MKEFFVYITTNPNRTTLYTGISNDLERRLIEHYQNRGEKETFAGKYYCYQLLFYDAFSSSTEAIAAEKYIKGKSRAKKMEIIKSRNPSLAFLNKKVCSSWPPKS